MISARPAERTLIAAALALSLCAVASKTIAQGAARPTRVLLLFQQQAETPPMREFGEQLRRTLRQELTPRVEFYQEALDLDRFSGSQRSAPLAAYFAEKYRGFGIDVVVPVGGRALTFAVEQLRAVLPGVPIVFALCAAPQTNRSSLPANVTGRLAGASRFVPTLMMARRLQPDAERIVVVGGAGPSDSSAVSAVESAVRSLGTPLPITRLQGLTLDVMLRKLRQLRPRSIVVLANYRQDANGQAFEPLDIVGSIARAAAAPMYTQLRSYVGEGVVGGSVTRFDDEGARTARLVVRVLGRQRGDPMPPVQLIQNAYVADWRQLRRWGLSERRLPAGTELLFREPDFWERYGTILLLSLAVAVAESLLIARLIREQRRRKHAQLVVDQQQQRAEEARRQMTHMGRVALVAELAATISHEIRQPLAAIRTNAETGAKFVSRNADGLAPEHRRMCEDIFKDIIADNDHASNVITRVGALLRSEELPQRPVDFNEICRASARLLQHDARSRHADIVLSLDPQLPPVVGDPVQFEQVVLNLALNGLDACAASADPRVVISTGICDEGVEVAVRDNGPGLTTDVQQHLFESFFTTKSQGLGLGLVIVQSIVERHHGRVRAENHGEGGATFRVLIPCAKLNSLPASAEQDSCIEGNSGVPSSSMVH